MNEEKEVKILLSREEYERLDKLFNWNKDFVQINHYYGSKDDFISKTNTYRVREKNKEILLQVKIPCHSDGSLHVKKEYEKKIECVPDCLRKEELECLLGRADMDTKRYLGNLITYRKISLEDNGVEICLDKNEYLNQIDYELELEYIGEYPSDLIFILKKNGIMTNNGIDGKYTRFLKKYKEYTSNTR